MGNITHKILDSRFKCASEFKFLFQVLLTYSYEATFIFFVRHIQFFKNLYFWVEMSVIRGSLFFLTVKYFHV